MPAGIVALLVGGLPVLLHLVVDQAADEAGAGGEAVAEVQRRGAQPLGRVGGAQRGKVAGAADGCGILSIRPSMAKITLPEFVMLASSATRR
jgi:hypothetical protein